MENVIVKNRYWILALLLLIAAILACNMPSVSESQVEEAPPPTESEPAQDEQAPPPTESEPVQDEQAPPTEETEPPIVGGDEVANPRYDLDIVTDLIKDSIMQRDAEAMVQLMGDPFGIGYWQSEGQALPPTDAANELVMGWIIPGNPLSFIDDADLPSMLGTDPLGMWGPDVDTRSAFLALGWGSNATSEAIIIIAYQEDIGYYWHGVIVAPEGFVVQGDNMTFWQQFEAEVMRAITERDLEAMTALMSDPFGIALWQSQGTEISPQDAVQQINANYPPEGSQVEFGIQPDLTTLLGQNPADFFGGGISFFHSTGWYEDGAGEAIIVLDADEDGTLRWTKIMFAPSGF